MYYMFEGKDELGVVLAFPSHPYLANFISYYAIIRSSSQWTEDAPRSYTIILTDQMRSRFLDQGLFSHRS